MRARQRPAPDAPAPSTIAFLLRHASPRQVALLVALMAGVALTEGAGVLALLPILGGMQGGGQGGGQAGGQASGRIAELAAYFPSPTASLAVLLVIVTLLAGLRTLLVYARQVTQVMLQNDVVDALRARAFDAVLHAEWRWLVQTRGSDHANLILTNVSRAGIGLNQLLGAVALGIGTTGYLAAALLLSWRVALVALAIGAVVLALFASARTRAAGLGAAIGEGGKVLHAHVHQAFAGVRIVKAYRDADRQNAQFTHAIARLRDQGLQTERMTGRGQAVLQFGSAVALALVVGIGHLGFGVALPVLLPLLVAFARLAPMLGGMQASWSLWRHMAPAVAEVRDMLARADAVREPAMPAGPAPRPVAAIRLQGVTVRHAARTAPALDAVSLTLPVNRTIALCGASGAGKSTLADVLMGLVVPDEGGLFVDDVAIAGAARIAWRASVAYVQQDPFLFHDTIRANILLGRTADEGTIVAALERAGARFVLDLPDGLDTIVGDAGARLSGGERQRVALARALLGAPALLILDEATSALDPVHEQAVRATLAGLRGRMTIVFITHREDMHADADQVVRIENGRVA